MQKLYCYVDETGQDTKSEIFIVVAVVSDKDQNMLRQSLVEIEKTAKTGQRKWHKSCSERRMNYLQMVLERKVGKGEIFFGRYKKPIPYFLPTLDLLEKAIKERAENKYLARVYIDGIDRKKAGEMTNALRVRGISLELVKSRRDESEPLIRLADMWAGCIRGASLDNASEKEMVATAEKEKYLENLMK